jgi:hypothetical protein
MGCWKLTPRINFLADLRLNYLRIKWNDTAILHDLSRSFHPRKTTTSPDIFRHAGFRNVVVITRKIPSSILGGNNGLLEKF